jgi:hypothetical protein
MEPALNILDLLNLHVQLVTTPTLTVQKAAAAERALAGNGFRLQLEAVLPYAALSQTITAYLHGTRLDVSEGFIKQYIILNACTLYSSGENLVIKTSFSGSYNGTVVFTGKPLYHPQTKTIALDHMTYDLKTDSFLLKGLKWLFEKLILAEIKKYTAIDTAAYLQKASEELTKVLNGEWAKGIHAAGTVTELDVTGIQAQQDQLLIAMKCRGNLHLTVSALRLKF